MVLNITNIRNIVVNAATEFKNRPIETCCKLSIPLLNVAIIGLTLQAITHPQTGSILCLQGVQIPFTRVSSCTIHNYFRENVDQIYMFNKISRGMIAALHTVTLFMYRDRLAQIFRRQVDHVIDAFVIE